MSSFPASRIRWDRVGRVALLCVLVLVVALYVNPLMSWWSTWQQSKATQAEISALERHNEKLRARRDELRDPRTLEREARALGMVKPGERPYVVRGLPE
jgi:cell division protein FtsB